VTRPFQHVGKGLYDLLPLKKKYFFFFFFFHTFSTHIFFTRFFLQKFHVVIFLKLHLIKLKKSVCKKIFSTSFNEKDNRVLRILLLVYLIKLKNRYAKIFSTFLSFNEKDNRVLRILLLVYCFTFSNFF